MKDIEKALTKGLVTGYVSGKPENIDRAGFKGKASDILIENGTYHDE